MGGPVGGEHCRLSREGGLLCDCYPRLEASSLLSRAGTARPLPAARLSARLGETRWGSLTPTVNGGPLVGKARLSIWHSRHLLQKVPCCGAPMVSTYTRRASNAAPAMTSENVSGHCQVSLGVGELPQLRVPEPPPAALQMEPL